MAVDPKTKPIEVSNAAPRRWMSIGEITEPGAYVTKETGDLIRVPPAGGSDGEDELFDKSSRQPLLVAKVSDNPFIPITKARFAAAALDIEVSF